MHSRNKFTSQFVNIFIVFIVMQITMVDATMVNGVDKDCTYNDEKFQFKLCNNVSSYFFCSINHAWLRTLYQEAMTETNQPPRQRREIRSLSDTERRAFFNAVNEIKKDTSVKPNVYDAFAMVHFNRTLCSVHKGSNFLGWHRIYILLFETLLRQKDKTVALPYWASTIDNNPITDHTQLFDANFFGNGNGYVTTGPFQHWNDSFGCPLERGISRNGTVLMSHEIVNKIENDLKILDIGAVTDAGRDDINETTTIEYQHNMLHDWVGGMMSVLDASSRDPLFFLHHAYIDYIWEKFREKQKRMGINPELNYPGFGDKNYTLQRLHAATRPMDCFNWIDNIDGYSNNFTNTLYHYTDLPICPNCDNSKYLICNITLKRCIPRRKRQGVMQITKSVEFKAAVGNRKYQGFEIFYKEQRILKVIERSGNNIVTDGVTGSKTKSSTIQTAAEDLVRCVLDYYQLYIVAYVGSFLKSLTMLFSN